MDGPFYGTVALFLCMTTGTEIFTIYVCMYVRKKVKVAHTRLPSVGFGADPGSWQSACM